ncbi:hypothetical protein MKW92_048453 [Papaver armeniacum]|nr:hypothetical protein MKW92_048453 [Papaver armeniacum]
MTAVCRWTLDLLWSFNPSSLSALISGSAVDQIEVVGYVSLGYPFGWTASILFGRHHKLENKFKSATGRVETHLIEGAGHFQMKGPSYDANMVGLIIGLVSSS